MAIHKVFRPVKKGDELSCAYLYADGLVVTVFERRVRDLNNTIRYAKIADSIGIKTDFVPWTPEPHGRVVFHEPAILIAASLMPGPVRVSPPLVAIVTPS